jgi:hypothetical protein
VICWEYKRNRHYGERHETNRNCNLRDRPFHRRRCMRRQIAGRKRQGSASGRYAGLIESKRPFVLDPSLARAVERAASGSPCLPPFRVPVASAVRVKEKPRRQGRGKLDRDAKMEKSGPHYGANTGERLCNHSCTNIKPATRRFQGRLPSIGFRRYIRRHVVATVELTQPCRTERATTLHYEWTRPLNVGLSGESQKVRRREGSSYNCRLGGTEGSLDSN